MINIYRLFNTRDDAERFVQTYLSEYPVAGYGTELEITEDGSEWAVVGTRRASSSW